MLDVNQQQMRGTEGRVKVVRREYRKQKTADDSSESRVHVLVRVDVCSDVLLFHHHWTTISPRVGEPVSKRMIYSS